jgi:hypothetical protein
MIATSLKRFAAAALAAVGFSLPASATSYSTDYTDLWYVGESESGWGINFIQQAEIIFATMFVYGQDNTPRWYVASGLSSSGGSATFSGQLFRTTGPYFGGAWTANAVSTAVGNMSVTFTSPTTATLSYSVDGVNVTKNIQRQTWRVNNVAGKYVGGILAIGTNCGGGVAPGPIAMFDQLQVNQAGNALSVRIDFVNERGFLSFCTMNGTMTTQGKLGTLSGGQFSCTFGGQQGNQGTFNLTAIDVTNNGLSANFTGQDQFCTYNGRFGGLRDVI